MKQVVSISLGSSDQDFEFVTTFLGVKMRVQRIGNKAVEVPNVTVTAGGTALTYAELDRESNAVAAGLMSHGIGAGDLDDARALGWHGLWLGAALAARQRPLAT